MGCESYHVSSYYRSKDQRYRLRGRAELSSAELDLLIASGATVSKILECTREQLEYLYPELKSEDLVFAWPELLELVAAK